MSATLRNFMDKSEEIQALYDYALEKYNAQDYAEASKSFKQASDLGHIWLKSYCNGNVGKNLP